MSPACDGRGGGDGNRGGWGAQRRSAEGRAVGGGVGMRWDIEVRVEAAQELEDMDMGMGIAADTVAGRRVGIAVGEVAWDMAAAEVVKGVRDDMESSVLELPLRMLRDDSRIPTLNADAVVRQIGLRLAEEGFVDMADILVVVPPWYQSCY